jgi:hypothetical protein
MKLWKPGGKGQRAAPEIDDEVDVALKIGQVRDERRPSGERDGVAASLRHNIRARGKSAIAAPVTPLRVFDSA